MRRAEELRRRELQLFPWTGPLGLLKVSDECDRSDHHARLHSHWRQERHPPLPFVTSSSKYYRLKHPQNLASSSSFTIITTTTITTYPTASGP
jgi:hypothetical protein